MMDDPKEEGAEPALAGAIKKSNDDFERDFEFDPNLNAWGPRKNMACGTVKVGDRFVGRTKMRGGGWAPVDFTVTKNYVTWLEVKNSDGTDGGWTTWVIEAAVEGRNRFIELERAS